MRRMLEYSRDWRNTACQALAVFLLWGPVFGALASHGAAAESSAAANTGERWKILGNGVLLDTRSRLEWNHEDNGEDIDWDHARAHCAGLGRGWRLPRLAELKSIYDEHAPGVRCAGAVCRVPPQFRLTGTWFWSGTQVGKDATDGSELAWGVLMVNGVPTQAVREAGYGSRVLCVRDP